MRAWWIVCLALLCLVPRPLWAHTALKGSHPSAGERLSLAPRGLRLTFTEALELGFSSLRLSGPAGVVALTPVALAPDSANVLVAGITGPLVPGGYTVVWQAASPDGHPVRGSFSFTIAPGAGGSAPESALPPAKLQPTTHDAVPSGPGFDARSPLYGLVRLLTFMAVLGVIGAVAFRLLIVRRAWRGGDAGIRALCRSVSERTARLGLAMAALALVAAALRLLAQSYALQGSAVWPLLSKTVWGWGWLLQIFAAVLAMAGFALAHGRASGARKTGWGLAAVGALLLAFTPALSGHAIATAGHSALAVLADGVHVLGAGGWLGSLMFVLAAGIPPALRIEHDRHRAIAALVRAFSPIALSSAGLVLLSGLLSGWLHLGSVAMLWNSAYGRLLSLKLLGVAALLGTGVYNFRRALPRLGDDRGTSRLRRSATVEVAIGVLVLLVTALLVATSPPVGM